MALQVNESITTREGAELSSFYVRVEPRCSMCGKIVLIEYAHYRDKASFKSSASTISKNEFIKCNYDRDADGVDIVAFAHDKVIEKMTSPIVIDDDGTTLPPKYSNVLMVDL